MYDRNRLSHRSVIVGELEVTPLPRIERRSEVMHDLLAVDPRIEPAVPVRRPFHVIDEVIPAVLHDRADLPAPGGRARRWEIGRSEEYTSELQSQSNLVCRLLLENKQHHLSLPPPARHLHAVTMRLVHLHYVQYRHHSSVSPNLPTAQNRLRSPRSSYSDESLELQ